MHLKPDYGLHNKLTVEITFEMRSNTHVEKVESKPFIIQCRYNTKIESHRYCLKHAENTFQRYFIYQRI
jgi:hypothetical protein